MTEAAVISDAAAMLDPEGGRIVGFAAPKGGRPQRIELTIDGARARSCLAAAPATKLGAAGFARLGPPPNAICAFEMRLPAGASGRRVAVTCGGRELLTLDAADPAAAKALGRYREGAVMVDSVTIENIRLEAGVLRARVIDYSGAIKGPVVTLAARGETMASASLKPMGDGRYDLSAPIDAGVLSDGVVVLELTLADGSVAGRLPIAAGAALASDLAAEVASLRAELDQLKRAFRSEIAGGVIRRDERPMIVAEALTQVDHLLEMRDRADQRQEALKGDEIWDEDDAAWDVDQ